MAYDIGNKILLCSYLSSSTVLIATGDLSSSSTSIFTTSRPKITPMPKMMKQARIVDRRRKQVVRVVSFYWSQLREYFGVD